MRRRNLLLLAGLVFWPLLGLAVMAWGFHTTDEGLGRAALEVGRVVGSVGVLGTLLWAYVRRP